MSYIAPNSDIYILTGIPFDETYQHTIYFASVSDQYYYFADGTRRKYTLTAQSYQRVKRNYIRVNILADNLYDCNYLMFKNRSYGDKWFYAFITNVEYINDSVSEIHYQIDVLQTWIYGGTFSFNPCFIEREHTVTDVIGENLVPEGLDIGDYITSNAVIASGQNLIPTGISIIVASTAAYFSDQDHTIVDYNGGRWYSGIYSGVRYSAFTTATDANQFLTDLTNANKADSILCVFLAPTAFFDNSYSLEPYESSVIYSKPYTSIDGYLPKNKKLFTYPYQFLAVDTGGNIANYNYEYFSTSGAELKCVGTLAETASYMIFPMSYKDQTNNLNEAIFDNCGTQCSFNIDAYKAWMAQNQYTLAAQEKVIVNNYKAASRQAGYQTGVGLGNALTAALQGFQFSGNGSGAWSWGIGGSQADPGAMTSGLVQAGQGFLNFLDARTQYQNANLMLQATKDTASIKPNVPQGSATAGLRIGAGYWRPRVYNMHIRAEFARIIDGYFTRYGYASHKFKVPTLNNRPHWTYVKTVDCSINAPIPNDDASEICTIMNSGITFWMHGNEVGNYTLDNSPT